MIKAWETGQGRSLTIDAVKGTAIFFVLWGHCIQFSSAGDYDFYGDLIFRFIYSFHMPLLAFISGYLFFDSLGKRTLKQSVKAKLTGLLWPLLLWCTVRAVLDILLSILKGEAVCFVQFWWEDLTGMFLWFLWSILAASVCVAFAVKLLPEKLQAAGIAALCFVMYLFPNEEMNLYLYPYFVIGYYTRKREKDWRAYMKQSLWIAGPVFLVMLVFFHNQHYIYISGITPWVSDYGWMPQLGIDLYRYAIGLAGSIFVIGLVDCGVRCLPDRVIKAAAACGRQSMQIYIFQCFCLSWVWSKIWSKIVKRLGFNPLTGQVILYWIFTLLMTLVLLAVFLTVIKSVKKRPRLHGFLFGR